jgi:hypothetical protein
MRRRVRMRKAIRAFAPCSRSVRRPFETRSSYAGRRGARIRQTLLVAPLPVGAMLGMRWTYLPRDREPVISRGASTQSDKVRRGGGRSTWVNAPLGANAPPRGAAADPGGGSVPVRLQVSQEAAACHRSRCRSLGWRGTERWGGPQSGFGNHSDWGRVIQMCLPDPIRNILWRAADRTGLKVAKARQERCSQGRGRTNSHDVTR